MKIGLIGCGGMGSTHNQCLKALSQAMDIRVTALADCREEYLNRAADIWPGAGRYRTGMELLEQAEIDTVFLCLPSYLHAEHALAAMDRGFDIFLEKPACLTERDAEALAQHQKKRASRVMVGQVLRSSPEYVFLKELVDGGKYGALKSLVMRRISGNPRWGFEDWFHDESKSGSVVLDLHIHDLDFLRWLLGEPDSFSACGTRFDSGMVNQIVVDYRFGSILVSAEGVWNVAPDMPFEAGYRAGFEKATVVYDTAAKDPLVVYFKEGGSAVPKLETGLDTDYEQNGMNIKNLGAYFLEDRYFLGRILANREIERAPLAEGLASVRLGLRELRAVKEALNS